MKRTGMTVIALIVCLAALAAGSLSIFGNSIGLRYADADKYTAGDAALTEAVENLDVRWASGEVRLAYHAGSGVRISETGSRELSGDDRLRWWLDGGTLRIRYEKSGKIRLFDSLRKTLTISLPEGAALKKAEIHCTSGLIDIPELAADETELSVTSGAVNAAADTRILTADATSGELIIRPSGKAEKVALNITSGRIVADVGYAESLIASATSGTISLSGSAGDAVIGSTSGPVDVRLDAFRSLKIDVTSGDVNAALPEKPGFVCEAGMTSGNFSYEGFAFSKDGNVYTCGDGSGRCSIHTTSGNIRMSRAD